mmetsp:Transcript_9676/g.13210  ORF Transcript_9676/g.13210 Transcript_9676/m.13210 type:complete len:92 (+) Transcript_9676:234-509(+)
MSGQNDRFLFVQGRIPRQLHDLSRQVFEGCGQKNARANADLPGFSALHELPVDAADGQDEATLGRLAPPSLLVWLRCALGACHSSVSVYFA